MQGTAIEVSDLRKNYDGRPVLRGVTFSVAEGEIFGIAGRNGAGKTTTVEALQGLRRPDGGTLRVLGLDPERDRAALRPLMGAQLQTAALPDRLRVGEALRLFARLAGDVVDPQALAATWGLEGMLRQAFGTLSGGQRQRVFLALAMVNAPRVVFLDELTQGLDPAARRETWALVEQVRSGGATVVLVTHDMDEVERLCDRVAVLRDGVVIASGTPDAIAGTAGGVTVRFSSPSAAALDGLERLPGVAEVRWDGARAELRTQPRAVVHVAAELARRSLDVEDFTVVRPTLEESVLNLLGGAR